MPEGVFSLLQGSGLAVGESMVKNPMTKAVAFTGSFQGGTALFKLATAREEPIPCFAEMGSINPVFLLPERLKEQPINIADQYVDSVNLGVGQFCTNPGIVIGIKSPDLDTFMDQASKKMAASTGGTMLHSGIKTNFEKSVSDIETQKNVGILAQGSGEGNTTAKSKLLKTQGTEFIQNPKLHEELFGPASMVVECIDEEEIQLVARSLKGNLTATLQATPGDLASFSSLLKILERKVGRILVNGVPTGVEVCHSMVHGGPFPASTDSRFTSVGTSAIKRFLRPICYQNFPEDILREELRHSSTPGVWKKIDGEFIK